MYPETFYNLYDLYNLYNNLYGLYNHCIVISIVFYVCVYGVVNYLYNQYLLDIL